MIRIIARLPFEWRYQVERIFRSSRLRSSLMWQWRLPARPHQGDVWTQQFRDQMLAASPEYKLSLDEMYLPNQPHEPTAITGRHITAATLAANTNHYHYIVKPDFWLTDNAKFSGTWLRERPENRQPVATMSPGPNSSAPSRVRLTGLT